jgi:hypothetical protein
MDCDCAYF